MELLSGPSVGEGVSTADTYDASYYGSDPARPPKANYRGYSKWSQPHWAAPLARLIAEHAPEGQLLDLGCAFGHLVRELWRLGRHAWGIEWSDFAYGQRVSEYVIHGDVRSAVVRMEPRSQAAVISTDFLEHLSPADGALLIKDLVDITAPGGMQFHLIGAHNPADDLSAHLSDPTHLNHEPLAWYIAQFEANGMRFAGATYRFNSEPAWASSDWNGRWAVFRDARGSECACS